MPMPIPHPDDLSSSLPKHVRLARLNAIVDQLHPDEWRLLRDRLNVRSFKCDILGSLPVEVVAQVAKYLGLSDILVLQRVSQQWRFLLSSPLVQSTALHHRCGVALSTAECDSSFVRHARRRIMLERGIPSSVVHYPLPRKTSSHAPPVMDCSRGKCAWVEVDDDGRCRGIALRDLRSGEVQHFVSENRVPFSHVRVSDTIVAAVSVRGYCHVWSHQSSTNQDTSLFRLPSMHFDFFLASGPKVAFGFADSVLAWSFHSRIAHVIAIGREILFMSLDSQGDTFTTVHTCQKTNHGRKEIDPTTLRVSKYPLPLDGTAHPHATPVSTYTLPITSSDQNLILNTPLLPPGSASASPSPMSIPLITLSNNRLVALPLRNPSFPPQSHTDTFLFLSHDPPSNRLSSHILAYKYAYTNPIISVDCNILYYLVLGGDRVQIGVSNPHDSSSSTSPEKRLRISNEMAVPGEVGNERPYCSLYGDAELVVLLFEGGIWVWVFDY